MKNLTPGHTSSGHQARSSELISKKVCNRVTATVVERKIWKSQDLVYHLVPIGCPRIIRTCSFSRFSPLRWNRWCCGFQNFQNYSSGVKAKRHTLPKSAYYSVQSLDQVSVGESFFPFCSKTKQATRYWQEAQPRLPQQTHWHDICWRA